MDMDREHRGNGLKPYWYRIDRLDRLLWISKSVAFTGLLIFSATLQFWRLPAIAAVVDVLSFLSWMLALKESDKTSRTVSLVLVAVGTVLFVSTGASALQAVSAFSENTQVLMVMVLVPLLGTVIEVGGYSDSLSVVCQDLRDPLLLYFVASLLAYTTGSVLLNGAIALVWAVMAPIVKRAAKDPDTLLASSVPRGYNASLLWTPAGPPMAVALSLTGVSWGSVMCPGLLLSLVMLALATLVEIRNPAVVGKLEPSVSSLRTMTAAQQLVADQNDAHRDKREAWRRTGGLALGLVSFIGAVVCLESLGLSPIQAMVVCIAIAVPAWSFLLHKPKQAAQACASYVCRKIPDLSRQYLLMTTAGFIGTAVRLFINSRASDGIASGPAWLDGDHVFLFTLLTSAAIWLISIMGIHPLIGMTIVYSLISPLAPVYSQRHVALTLLLGSVLGFNISPVSATMLVTSSCCGKNTFDTGVKLQWRFVLSMWVTGSLVLSLLLRV
ncbi:MAG: hypothetical protein IMW97_06565 [Firmicutes bacterium]|nr:hypothetical protein [Candidatus Fermentithermobacillaceae bacterium]